MKTSYESRVASYFKSYNEYFNKLGRVFILESLFNLQGRDTYYCSTAPGIYGATRSCSKHFKGRKHD